MRFPVGKAERLQIGGGIVRVKGRNRMLAIGFLALSLIFGIGLSSFEQLGVIGWVAAVVSFGLGVFFSVRT